MRSKSHVREVERDISRRDNEDFVSAGPWELLTLLAVSLAFSVIHVATPALSAQVYGSEATLALRPTGAILTLGLICVLLPSRPRASPSVLLGMTCAFWALALRYAQNYLARDTSLIDALLIAWGPVLMPSQFGVNGTNDMTYWTPIIASSIVDAVFHVPLTVVLVTMLRQRAHKTQLPPLVTAGALGMVAHFSCTLLHRYHLVEASDVYRVIPLMALLSLITSRTYMSFTCSILCCCVVSWALQSTSTLSCSKLPQILLCRHEIGGFQVLASAASVTGRITVLENEKYRLLKAGHSLLGGEWIGAGHGQSIFAAFYMQAMAIYAFTPARRELDVLQIGLGVGTATKTLLDAPVFQEPLGKLSLTVVELDPKVIEYASAYFDLPSSRDNLDIRAMDATQYINTAANHTFDLISHDVFSGGGLAYELFTLQFFTQVQWKLKPGGILTVNFVYAPGLAQVNFEAVVATLRSLFVHVELYVESGRINTINNMVCFCSDSAMRLDIPDAGRDPQSTLEQTARHMKSWQYDMTPNDKSRILQDESVDGGVSHTAIKHGERRMAIEHWRLMRHLLPKPENQIWTSF